MKAILEVGEQHPLHNKVVEVVPTVIKSLFGNNPEVRTVDKHYITCDSNIFKDGRYIRSEKVTTYDYITAWAKEVIQP